MEEKTKSYNQNVAISILKQFENCERVVQLECKCARIVQFAFITENIFCAQFKCKFELHIKARPHTKTANLTHIAKLSTYVFMIVSSNCVFSAIRLVHVSSFASEM